MRFFNRHLTKREYLTKELEKEIRRASRGKIPKNIRISLAERTIGKMDFNNPYQMHKSLGSYAEILVHNFFAKPSTAK